MKEQKKIPTSKVARASRFVTTGVKLGNNYVKHYARKMSGTATKEALDEDNAKDVYNALSELKGSALKVAQMMSMDKNMLPKAYSDRFQMSQYSAPPLSGPLVIKTFQQYFKKSPTQLFDSFELSANNAASIGQVHVAHKDGKKLAVKIQYPGISKSIESDLKMVRPFAVQLLGLNAADVDKYMSEVKDKLIEETDYILERNRGKEIAEACKHMDTLFFPNYYSELSCERILTMDWLEGKHLGEFLKDNPSQEIRNKIGQALWDFYDYQIHTLKEVHADPHPGNFLMTEDGRLGIIDFGCIKVIPDGFYELYFTLINPDTFKDKDFAISLYRELQFIHEDDSKADIDFFVDIFNTMTELLGRPFHGDHFDFADDTYFNQIYNYSEEITKMKKVRESRVSRGVKDTLYINRTYFGLYNLLNQLGCQIETRSAFRQIPKPELA